MTHGPKCNFPVMRPGWFTVISGYKRRSIRRPCGKLAVWRLMFWGRYTLVSECPDMILYRCADHRESDVGLRAVATAFQEQSL